MSKYQLKKSIEYKKQLLKERAEKLSRVIENPNCNTDTIEIISFKLDKENFAIETKYVKEVYPLKDYTFLPCAPAFVHGLTNIRRRIMPIINLKVFFSLPNDPKTEKKLLLMASDDVEFALLIDAFNSIRTLSTGELQSSLPTLTGIRQEFLKGLVADGTVILDGKKILTSPYLAIGAD